MAGRLLVRQPHWDQRSPLQPPQKAGEQTHQPGQRQEVQVHRWEEMSSHRHTWNTHTHTHTSRHAAGSRLWRLINDTETRSWNVKNTCSFYACYKLIRTHWNINIGSRSLVVLCYCRFLWYVPRVSLITPQTNWVNWSGAVTTSAGTGRRLCVNECVSDSLHLTEPLSGGSSHCCLCLKYYDFLWIVGNWTSLKSPHGHFTNYLNCARAAVASTKMSPAVTLTLYWPGLMIM